MCGYIKQNELITNGIVVENENVTLNEMNEGIFFIIWLHFSWINPGIYKVYYSVEKHFLTET